jgi:hypothetical protein
MMDDATKQAAEKILKRWEAMPAEELRKELNDFVKEEQRSGVEVFKNELREYGREIDVDMMIDSTESEDGSIVVEVYYGKQGALDSKRLGFVFDEDGHSFYYFISRQKPFFVEDGDMLGLDIRGLVHRFYKKE